MRVHRPWDADIQRHTVFIQPGKDQPVSDWMDADGKPRIFELVFVRGAADVPDNLARYMVDHGIAQWSPLLLPPSVRTVEGYSNA